VFVGWRERVLYSYSACALRLSRPTQCQATRNDQPGSAALRLWSEILLSGGIMKGWLPTFRKLSDMVARANFW